MSRKMCPISPTHHLLNFSELIKSLPKVPAMSRQVPTPVVILFLALELYSKLDLVKKNISTCLFKYRSLLVKCTQSDPITVLTYCQGYQKSLVTDVPTMSRQCPDGRDIVGTSSGHCRDMVGTSVTSDFW